jgi:hypothetical protein
MAIERSTPREAGNAAWTLEELNQQVEELKLLAHEIEVGGLEADAPAA